MHRRSSATQLLIHGKVFSIDTLAAKDHPRDRSLALAHKAVF